MGFLKDLLTPNKRQQEESKESRELVDRIARLEYQQRVTSKVPLSQSSAAPPAPTVLRNPGTTGVTAVIAWNVVNDIKVTAYNIYRAVSATNSDIAERVAVIPQSPDRTKGWIEWTDSRAGANAYVYWVASVNAAGVESPRVQFKPGASTTANLTGSGTTGTIAKFTASGTLGNSAITDGGADIRISYLTAKTFLYSDANKAITSTAAPTNGQLLIGSTGAVPVVASLTAGANISVTPGAGSIAVAVTGAELTTNKDAVSGYAGLNAASRTTKGVDTTDYLIVDLATKGLVIKDTAGSPHYWLLSVTTGGVLTTTDLGTTKP